MRYLMERVSRRRSGISKDDRQTNKIFLISMSVCRKITKRLTASSAHVFISVSEPRRPRESAYARRICTYEDRSALPGELLLSSLPQTSKSLRV